MFRLLKIEELKKNKRKTYRQATPKFVELMALASLLTVSTARWTRRGLCTLTARATSVRSRRTRSAAVRATSRVCRVNLSIGLSGLSSGVSGLGGLDISELLTIANQSSSGKQLRHVRDAPGKTPTKAGFLRKCWEYRSFGPVRNILAPIYIYFPLFST